MNKMLGLKALVIAALTLVILLALVAVGGIVESRQRFRDEAIASIAESYAGAQTFVGPVLVQPYTQDLETRETTDSGKVKVTSTRREASQLTFPAKLTLDAVLQPSERRHGLYRAAVYVMDSRLTAMIDTPDAPPMEGRVIWGEPYLAFELTDVRGIIGRPEVLVNGAPAAMAQGGLIRGAIEELSPEPAESRSQSSYIAPKVAVEHTKQWQPNLRVRLPNAERGKKAHYDLAIKMQIAGTQRLSLGPVGDLNQIDLRSAWPSPLFAGQFLPQAPEVSAKGFHATWNLSSLAAATQQQIIAGDGAVDALNVTLLTTIDPYKLSDRATKYGILFVVLTFGGFFLFEIMKQLPIHPVQYLLVGFGLAIFFLLLISFSEHIAFAEAYVLASAACIGLLTFYLVYVLRSVARAAAFGAMLALLYAAVYGLLISEDNALVLGSLMLFLLLAIVMVITRKVDWYKGSAELARVKAAQAAASLAPAAPAAPPPPGV